MPDRSARDAEFTAFAQTCSGALRRTAWLLTGNLDQAGDLVQATLVKTYLAWSRVRPGDALAFARRVMMNESIDRWRRRHGEVPVGVDFDRALPDDPHERVAERDEVVRMLAGLAPQQRAVIVLRFVDDLSERETARQLGISVGTVKSATSRGLASLRASYAPLLSEGELR